MQPPVLILEWKYVVNYAFISEFDLLRHSHTQDSITKKPWTIPYNREVAAKYWKMRGARDEITRLNVELKRLHTHVILQDAEFNNAIEKASAIDLPLAAELRVQHRKWTRINAVYLQRINTIVRLPGFSGSRDIGTPIDSRAAQLLTKFSDQLTTSMTDSDSLDDHGQDDFSDDEAMAKLSDMLEQFAVAG